MSQSNDAPVLVEHRGPVVVITLNRPQARNAVDPALASALGDAIAEFSASDADRVAVVTGAGSSFCAGADLKAIGRGEALFAEGHREWGFAGFTEQVVDKPIVAAVNGPAAGGGAEIALHCDLVVAADTASFALPEVKRGLLAGAGGVIRLARQIPSKVANEMVLLGKPLTAERALEHGLVNAVVPAEDVVAEAVGIAERLAENAPLAVQASKRLMRSSWADGLGEPDLWSASNREFVSLMRSEDAKEGPRAFAEKRAPVWSGR